VHIVFPPGETDDTSRWIVWFLAVVNGKPCELFSKAIEVKISRGTTFLYLGSESSSINFAFPKSGIASS
jgi:hypothetical protein